MTSIPITEASALEFIKTVYPTFDLVDMAEKLASLKLRADALAGSDAEKLYGIIRNDKSWYVEGMLDNTLYVEVDGDGLLSMGFVKDGYGYRIKVEDDSSIVAGVRIFHILYDIPASVLFPFSEFDNNKTVSSHGV